MLPSVATTLIYIQFSPAFLLFAAGNDPDGPQYDMCFGGRRKFCMTKYEDLGECSFKRRRKNIYLSVIWG